MMDTQNFYYASESGEPVGPFSLSHLREMLDQGILAAETQVHAERAGSWVSLSSVLEHPYPSSPPPLPAEPPKTKTSQYQEVAEKIGFVPDLDKKRNLIQVGISAGFAIVGAIVGIITGTSAISLGIAGLITGVIVSGALLMALGMANPKSR